MSKTFRKYDKCWRCGHQSPEKCPNGCWHCQCNRTTEGDLEETCSPCNSIRHKTTVEQTDEGSE